MMRKSISTFSDENTATYISAFSNDAAMIEENYLKCIQKLIEYTVWFFSAFALMLWYSPILTLIAVPYPFVPIIASLVTGGKMAKAEKEVCGIFGKAADDTEEYKRKRNRLQSETNCISMLAGVTAQLAVFLIGAALAGGGKSITQV